RIKRDKEYRLEGRLVGQGQPAVVVQHRIATGMVARDDTLGPVDLVGSIRVGPAQGEVVYPAVLASHTDRVAVDILAYTRHGRAIAIQAIGEACRHRYIPTGEQLRPLGGEAHLDAPGILGGAV